MEKLLTIKEASALLKVAERTLRIWIRDGKLAGIKLPNGEWRIKQDNLENWLKARTVKARI